MWYLFISGLICGIVIEKLLSRKNHIGTLRIDNSDSDGPYLFLELSKNISSFDEKKQVILDVRNENYISHK